MAQVIECLFRGTSSAFEHMATPEISVSNPCCLDTAHAAVAWLLVQIPGLVCLVRRTGSYSIDASEVDHVVALAQELCSSEANVYVKETLAEHTWTLDCSNDNARSPTGTSLDFSSLSAFVLATRYHLCRMLLCGVLQTLASFGEATIPIDKQTVEDQDVTAATAICMCLDYATRADPAMPLTALAMVIPLQVALGSWDRLERRQASTASQDYRRAVRSSDWILDQVHWIDHMWRSTHTNHERMRQLCNLFAGGPAIAGLCDFRDDSLRNALTKLSGG